MVMPGMGGRDLAVRMGEIKPGIRVLLMSGYPQETDTPQEDSLPEASFLQKPFKRNDLLRKVRGSFHAGRAG